MRRIRYYPPEERPAGELQCTLCGNTQAFYLNLRLRHRLTLTPDSQLQVSLDERLTRHILRSIAENLDRMLEISREYGREIIHCANCGQSETLDKQSDLQEWCGERGCPGCEICGQYIAESEVRELCNTCIREHEGLIAEDDCLYGCPYYEDGLGAVLEHYGLSLAQLKQELGY